MHARKLPRISEPSFDKDYYDKGGGSSKLKYGRESRRSGSPDSSRSKSYSSSSRDHHREHRDHHRDYSSSSRRHYHHRDYERNERYGSGSGSGGMKRSSSSWGNAEPSKKIASGNSSNNHSNGHEVSSATGMTNNSEDASKLKILGDWSEHISSSKRKYYYNCVTEVSQWEKPREWIEYEQQQLQQQQPNSRSSRSSRLVDHENRTSSSSSSSSNNGHSNKHSNNNNSDRRHYHENHHSSSSHHHRRKRTNDDHMEISSRDSTPVSEEDEGRMIDDIQTITPFHNDTHEVVNNVVSTHDALKTIQSALLLTTTASTNSIIVQNNDSPYTGPPTPTHSEEMPYPIEGSVNSIPMQQVSLQTVTPSALSQQQPPPLPSLSSLKPAAPSLPSLTPTLAKLYKDSLVSHVLGWPAEGIEKVCQRVNEEHTNISNLGITKVSADLKMARSLVRLAEIQATLQEQRILFLRQQSLDLENMKLNSNLVQAASGPATLISSSLVNVSSSELSEIQTLVASSAP
ncbi:WAC [Lepeophtheirus salmonis]|uniref:WAC n=1 Tax=Lepeophtheirus salmonis TaxID=72036 RepID=A0A7R8CXX5_LEPSM|nr:WAC [Lepeophtheirus salmonis]CAF2965154.1 WAC [Lepeophtheirus salmonis]